MSLVQQILPTAASFSFTKTQKSPLVENGIDLGLIGASFIGAHLLRFGGFPPSEVLINGAYLLPVIGLFKLFVFHRFHLYEGLWKHAGTPEAVRIIKATTVSSGALLIGFALLPNTGSVPIALFVLDWLLTTATMGAHRFGRRVLHQAQTSSGSQSQQQILIYGADAFGAFLLRYLQNYGPATCTVVGFLDPSRAGLQLKGLPVVETPSAFEADVLIVPVSSSTKRDPQHRDHAQIFDTYSSSEIECHQFEITLAPTSTTSPSETEMDAPTTTKVIT